MYDMNLSITISKLNNVVSKPSKLNYFFLLKECDYIILYIINLDFDKHIFVIKTKCWQEKFNKHREPNVVSYISF